MFFLQKQASLIVDKSDAFTFIILNYSCQFFIKTQLVGSFHCTGLSISSSHVTRVVNDLSCTSITIYGYVIHTNSTIARIFFRGSFDRYIITFNRIGSSNFDGTIIGKIHCHVAISQEGYFIGDLCTISVVPSINQEPTMDCAEIKNGIISIKANRNNFENFMIRKFYCLSLTLEVIPLSFVKICTVDMKRGYELGCSSIKGKSSHLHPNSK